MSGKKSKILLQCSFVFNKTFFLSGKLLYVVFLKEGTSKKKLAMLLHLDHTHY